MEGSWEGIAGCVVHVDEYGGVHISEACIVFPGRCEMHVCAVRRIPELSLAANWQERLTRS